MKIFTSRFVLVVLSAFLLIAGLPFSSNAQQTPPNPDESFELGESPLSDAEMDQLMLWIAAEVAAARVPYCYRQSFGRTAGEFPNAGCKADQELNGALCYPKCKPGYVGNGPACWMPCPAGLKDIGAFCQKPAPYDRGAGYVIWDEKKCSAEHPEGCEKAGAIWYPKCKPNFHGVVTVCSPDCPTGWADTGTGCTKPTYGRTAGEPMLCRTGLERVADKDGLLCYPPCNKPNYTGIGPVCWQTCPSQYSVSCGAGCATTKAECAITTANMVAAPFIALISLMSLGTAGAAASAARAAGESAEGIKLAVKTAQEGQKGAQILAKIKEFLAAKNLLQAKNFDKVVKLVKYGSKTYTVVSAGKNEVELFTKEFDSDFENRTTPKVAEKINTTFGPEGRSFIKRRWALYHINLMFEADEWATAQNVVSGVSVADPTGLTGVVHAYLHPVCKDSRPFPTLNVLYNR